MVTPSPQRAAARRETAETRIEGGIEWFDLHDGRGEDCQCARCGSSCDWLSCPECFHGYTGHDCGEDTCCCAHPEENVVCGYCDGTGGAWHCLSTPAWCSANPLPDREHIPSTALRSEAWSD